MNFRNKYERNREFEIEVLESVQTFVPTKKNASVEFRITEQLKAWLKSTYPNGKMSSYIESLIYADHRKQGINIYEVKKESPRLTLDELDIKKFRR